MRTDVFYVYYYFLTTSIYITSTTNPAVDSTTSAQKVFKNWRYKKISK